jgi:cyclin D2
MEIEMSKKLANMLELEEYYVTRHSYFTSRVTPWHRHKLLTWLLEVCEAESGDLTESAFGLAVNMFDRFMAKEARRIDVAHLQLLGCVCLFIASKVANGRVLSAEKLADYTDNSISVRDILEWESLVLASLQWDVASIQANDYLDLLVDNDKLGLDASVVRRTRVYTALCLTEFKFAFYPASMLAAACLLVSKPNAKGSLADLLELDLECLIGLTELVSSLITSVLGTESADTQCCETVAVASQQSPVEFEDDYDFLLDEIQFDINEVVDLGEQLSPPISGHNSDVSSDDNNNNIETSKKSSNSKSSRKMPNQLCSYYILTPPQPSSLHMPTF